MHRLVLLNFCVIRPMSGDTVQTGSRKIDPARKFKCTLAARGPVCWMYNVIENQTMWLIIGLSVFYNVNTLTLGGRSLIKTPHILVPAGSIFYNVNTPTLGGRSLIKTPHILAPAGSIFCRIETTQLQIWRKKISLYEGYSKTC